jgi:hypothetical protein
MMVISTWPSRPTMREKAPLTGRTVSPAFERHATTYKKFRMPTTGQVRGDFHLGLRFVPEPSARTKILPAASYSPTTKKFYSQQNFSTRRAALGVAVCVSADCGEVGEIRRSDNRDSREYGSSNDRDFCRDRGRFSELCGDIFGFRGVELSSDLSSIESSVNKADVPDVYSYRSPGMRF